MRRIVGEYGQEINILECTLGEFWILKNFLAEVGVEIRWSYYYQGVVKCQVRNAHRETCKLYKERDGGWIDEHAEKSIKMAVGLGKE